MKEMQFVEVGQVDAHFHNPEWYRPLLFGDNLYLNVTYLLTGVKMVMGSVREREHELVERAVYVLSGNVTVTRGQETVEAGPASAFLVPSTGESVIVVNTSESAAVLITAMSPVPHPELNLVSRQQLRQLYLDSNRRVLSPTELSALLAGKIK